ncbi:hypothetical protein AXF35_04805 [Legionella pneumophila subsp. pascullei]|nr:hypothetical protein AXF35_04805 [Legionella pneumophila subsp. pascullei]
MLRIYLALITFYRIKANHTALSQNVIFKSGRLRWFVLDLTCLTCLFRFIDRCVADLSAILIYCVQTPLLKAFAPYPKTK